MSYPAFSGLGRDVNDPAKVNDAGAIPPGRYNIVDRPVGGRFPMIESTIHDLISHSQRTEWFALYSTSSNSDHMTVQKIKRGNFRLQPIGRLGISEGCITLMHQSGFDQLRTILLATPKTFIPGTKIRTYGTVEVRRSGSAGPSSAWSLFSCWRSSWTWCCNAATGSAACCTS